MSAPPEKLKWLVLAFARHGITDRADRLRLMTEDTGRHIWSGRALTEPEVDALLARLERLPVGALPSHAARLRQEEAARAARAASEARYEVALARVAEHGARLCGPRPPTAHDLETVAEFAEQLDVLAAAGLLPPEGEPATPRV